MLWIHCLGRKGKICGKWKSCFYSSNLHMTFPFALVLDLMYFCLKRYITINVRITLKINEREVKMIITKALERTSQGIRRLGQGLVWARPYLNIFWLNNGSDSYPASNTSVHKVLDPSFLTYSHIWVKLGDPYRWMIPKPYAPQTVDSGSNLDAKDYKSSCWTVNNQEMRVPKVIWCRYEGFW